MRVEVAVAAAQAAGVDGVATVQLTASIAEVEVKGGVPDGVLAGREGNPSDPSDALALTTAPRTLVTVAATVAALEGAVEAATSLKKRRQVRLQL
jgi:hypothetical protein